MVRKEAENRKKNIISIGDSQYVYTNNAIYQITDQINKLEWD